MERDSRLVVDFVALTLEVALVPRHIIFLPKRRGVVKVLHDDGFDISILLLEGLDNEGAVLLRVEVGKVDDLRDLLVGWIHGAHAGLLTAVLQAAAPLMRPTQLFFSGRRLRCRPQF